MIARRALEEAFEGDDDDDFGDDQILNLDEEDGLYIQLNSENQTPTRPIGDVFDEETAYMEMLAKEVRSWRAFKIFLC